MSCHMAHMHKRVSRGFACCECGAIRCIHCERITEYGSDHAGWCASYRYRHQPADRPTLPQRLNDGDDGGGNGEEK